jgi:putative polyketide hydroxylase
LRRAAIAPSRFAELEFPMADRMQIPVLIIGGGPVGLSASILFSRFGIRSLLVERHPSTTDHPKARGVHARTMELFRQWGVEDAIRTHELPSNLSGFIWMDRLDGHEIGRVPLGDMKDLSYSPTIGSIVAQDAVEEELHAAAHRYDLAELLFGAEAALEDQTPAAVTAIVRDASGRERKVVAQYVIAADGASSPSRHAMGIAMNGPDAMARSINIYFRADLSRWFGPRPCVGFFFSDPALVGSSLLCVNGTDRWISINRAEPAEEFSTERCVNLIRDLVGVKDLGVEIINTAFWTMTAQVAQQYRSGPVFLAGDAAHRFPPTGGFGMNTGIQDVHNLVWKLAYVLTGRADPALLDTYEPERRPVAQSNTDFSVINAVRLGAMYQAAREGDQQRMAALIEDQRKHLANIGQQFAFHYDSAAVVPDGTPPPEFSPYQYAPTGRPGHRAPHLWLNRNGDHVSTLDLFDRKFALLTTPAGRRNAVALPEDAVDIFAIGDGGDLQDPEGRFCDLYGIEADGAVLVRPDGHVAWRRRSTGEAMDEIKTAFRSMRGYPAPTAG